MPDAPETEKSETDKTDAADAQPKYLTIDDFNRAQSARDKRFEARFEKMLAEKLALLSPKKEEPEEDADEAVAPPKADAAGAPDATARELARLKRSLEREKAEREKERGEREAQAAKISRDEERAKLADALGVAGIDPKKSRAAIALLHTEDKRVKRDETGRIVFLNEDGDELDLASGIKAWAASDEGKAFLPPRGAGGSGNEVTREPKGTKRTVDKKTAANAALLALLGGQPAPR
jgi:hypothetical protein